MDLNLELFTNSNASVEYISYVKKEGKRAPQKIG